jgi:hypothetical protein
MRRSKRNKKENKNSLLNNSRKIMAKGVDDITNVLKKSTNDLFSLVNKKYGSKSVSRKSRRKR